MILTTIKDIVKFSFHPSETIISRDKSCTELIFLLVLNLILAMATSMLILVILVLFRMPSPFGDMRVSLIPCVAGTLLEEVICRLPLVRKRWYVAVAGGLVATSIYCILGGYHFISLEVIWIKLIVLIIFGTISYIIYQYIRHINYAYYFYFFALIFGLFHLTNIDVWDFSLVFILVCLCYSISQIMGGIILAYTRMKYGFLHSCSLHLIHNMIALLN